MSQLIVCSECKKHLQVPDELVGRTVQCPECKHTFIAAAPDAPEKIEEPERIEVAAEKEPASEPEPKTKSKRRDDDDDQPRSPNRTRTGVGPDKMPGKVQAIGIMTLCGGIFALLLALGAGSTGVCCLWPGTYYSLVLGIMAIVKGSSILGNKGYLEKPPTGIAIMHIINIVNGDVVNLVLGIIIMVFCNDEEVQEYFAKK